MGTQWGLGCLVWERRSPGEHPKPSQGKAAMRKVLPAPHEKEKWESQKLFGDGNLKSNPTPPRDSTVGLPRLQPLCFNTFQAFVLILVVRGLQDMPGQEGKPWLSHTQIKKIWHLVQEMPAQESFDCFLLSFRPPLYFFFFSQKIHQGLPCP